MVSSLYYNPLSYSIFQANFLAIHSAVICFSKLVGNGQKPHIITTNIEHCAIELPLKHLEKEGLVGEKR